MSHVRHSVVEPAWNEPFPRGRPAGQAAPEGARLLERRPTRRGPVLQRERLPAPVPLCLAGRPDPDLRQPDRKSTRLNSSHGYISYAVFCLKKKSIRKTYDEI